MFNPLNLISKIIKNGNQKELDRIQKIIEQAFEKHIKCINVFIKKCER